MQKYFSVNENFVETKPTKEEIPSIESRGELLMAVGKKKMFKGFCHKCDREGNLYIKYGNVETLMKRNEISSLTEADGNVHKGLSFNKVGTFLNFNVLAADDNNIYITRKEIVKEIREHYKKELEIGQVVRGVITNINEKIGVYVDIGADYTALIPKSRLEHIFVQRITDHVNIGDEINAVVRDITKNDSGDFNDIILSRKEVLPTYAEMASAYQQGDTILAKVKNIGPTAIYANINEHLDIICELPGDIYLKEGQGIRVRVKNVGQSRITGVILSAL